MRKYFLGIIVGVTFLAYSIVLRHQHSEPIVAPASLSQSSTSSSATNSSASTSTNNNATSSSQYKDGTYTGSVADAFYGNVQVAAIILNGKITAVDFIQSPNENPNSIYVNQQADPYLKQEAIQAQNSNVSVITGATLTSEAFAQSLANALNQARQAS